MDLFVKHATSKDTRIHFKTMQLSDGTLEVYPQGSFVFDHLLHYQISSTKIVTQTTCTPNTFVSHIQCGMLLSWINLISRGLVGSSSGFFFYESTIWLAKKTQKAQTPFFYNLQTANILCNIRWSFIVRMDTTNVQSTSNSFLAASWPERELQDMYLVNFSGLKDTRRLLLDYKVGRGVLSPEFSLSGVPSYSTFFDVYYL